MPIVCTLQGEDLFLDQLHEPYKNESLRLIRQKVKDVDRFIAVSSYYAKYMAGYLSIPADSIRTVPLGINLRDYESAGDAPRMRTRRCECRECEWREGERA